MAIMHPIDILKAKRTEIEDERTAIQAEAKRIQARLSDISDIVAEYDAAIQREEQICIIKEETENEPDKVYPFAEESRLRPIKVSECNRICGELTYGRKGDQITIRTSTNKHVNTSWEYLCDYYNKLPDETPYNQIDLNKDKRYVLTTFYEHHPNFNCRIDPHGINSKKLVKEPIYVDIDTHVADKAEADISAY